MSNIATHTTPAWPHVSNFLIRADLSVHGMPGRFEQLWARKLDETTFEICCIPFFTYGIALGDMVQTGSDFTIRRVSQKGGHRTLRIAVKNTDKQDQIHLLLHEWIEGLGVLHEWFAPGYLAVDLPPGPHCDVQTSAIHPLVETGELSIEIDE